MNVGNNIIIFMNKMDWIANWHVDSFIHRANEGSETISKTEL